MELDATEPHVFVAVQAELAALQTTLRTLRERSAPRNPAPHLSSHSGP